MKRPRLVKGERVSLDVTAYPAGGVGGVQVERPQPRSGEDVRPGRRGAVGEARGSRAELISLSPSVFSEQA